MEPQKIKGFGRKGLRLLFRDSGYKIGAEIGVSDGKHAELLCRDIPNLKLYCIDMWIAYDCNGNKIFESPEMQQKNYEETLSRLSAYNTVILRKTSMDAVKEIPKGSLDFVYIDANHTYEYVMQDLTEWAKRVRTGGIVSGHDYNRSFPGVKKAVNDYVGMHNIDNCFVACKVDSSFWWVKQEKEGNE